LGELRLRGIWILNQEDLVSGLPIDEFVNELARAARQTHRGRIPCSSRKATWRIGSSAGVRDCRVRDLVKRKAQAGISDVARDHVTGTHVFNLDVLVRIQSSTMLDRIQKHFAKGRWPLDFSRDLAIRQSR